MAPAESSHKSASEPAQPEADVDELEAIWKRGGQGKWDAWARLRSIYAERGDMDALWAGMARAVEEGSPDWSDYANYGNRLLNQGSAQKALEVYEAGLKLAPDTYLLRFGKASALLYLDDKERALAAFKAALAVARQERSRQKMHLSIARLLHQQGRFDQARPHYQALRPEFIAAVSRMPCEVVAMDNQAGADTPPNLAFIRDATLHQSAAVASFALRTGDVSQGRQILSQLIECGVPRHTLMGLYDLGELARERALEL